MNEYDLVIVSQVESSGIDDQISKRVEELAGTVLNRERWGSRNLAYSINKLNTGNYDFFRFKFPTKSLSDFNSFLKSDKNIIRYLLLKSKTVIN